MAVEAAPRPRGLRLRLTCTTEAEFIALFINNCDDETVFVPTTKMLPAGTHVAFSVELADAQPMLRGLGVVKAAWPIDANRFKQAGVQIEVSQYTETSEAILGRLLAARDRAHRAANKSTLPRGVRRRAAPLTHQQWGSEIAPATMEMDCPPVADDDDDTNIGEAPGPITRQRASVAPPIRGKTVEEKTSAGAPRTITRERGISRPPTGVDSASAAPVAEMDEKTSQTIRYEGPLRTPAVPPPTPAPLPPVPRTSAPGAAATANAAAAPAPASASAMSSAFVPAETANVPSSSVATLPAQVAHASASEPPLRGVAPWWRSSRVIGVFAAGIVVGVLATVVMRPPASQPPAASADRVAQQCVEDKPELIVMASERAPAGSSTDLAETVAKPSSAAINQVSADAKPAAAEASPAVTKPTAKIAAAESPAVTKPPVATKPPAASKPAASKPAATKVSEAKPVNKPVARAAPRKRQPCNSLDCI